MKSLTVIEFKELLTETGIAKNAIVKADVQYGFDEYTLKGNVEIVNCELKSLHIANQQLDSLTISKGKIGHLNLATSSQFAKVELKKSDIRTLALNETSIGSLNFVGSNRIAPSIEGGSATYINEMTLSGYFKNIDVFQIDCPLIHLKRFSCISINHVSLNDAGDLLFEDVKGKNFIFQYGQTRQLKFESLNIKRFSNKPEFGA